MSTTTPTLSLTLYDSTTDQVVTFATFRAVWGGTSTTSNFYRIDTWAGTVNSSISTLQNQRGAIPVAASYISANYYEATVSSITSYTTGMTILLKLDTDSAGTVTLNISSLGTKSVTKINSSGTPVNIASGELQAGRYYLFTYDGTQWIWVDANSSDQIYILSYVTGNVLTAASDGSIDGTLTQSLLLSQTINSATAKTTLADSDNLGITDSAASNILKKITWANFKTAIGTSAGAIINALTGKTTPVGADIIVVGDSASSYASKQVLLSDLYKSLGTGTQNSTTFLRGDGTYANAGALSVSSASVTTSNVTGVAGTFHLLDISGMTANRDFNLPTPSSAGETCAVQLSVGDATYALLLKINGVEWSRIFITYETVFFFSTGTGAGDWVISYDGRIPCVCKIKDTATMNITNNSLTLINLDEIDNDNASLADTANDRIYIRRTGTYTISGYLRYDTLAGNSARVNASIRLNGGSTYPAISETSGLAGALSSLNPFIDNYVISSGDYIEMYGIHQSGSTEATYVSGSPTSLSVREILK